MGGGGELTREKIRGCLYSYLAHTVQCTVQHISYPICFKGGILVYRACSSKRLWSPGIDSEESIPPAYAAWRAGTTNRIVVPARQAGN